MNTEAKPSQSELAVALHEMVDGFRRVGVLSDGSVDHATQPSQTQAEPSTELR